MRKLFVFLIRIYQKTISPFLGANRCRFQPTCSEYSAQAILKYGILKGTWLGIKTNREVPSFASRWLRPRSVIILWGEIADEPRSNTTDQYGYKSLW